MAIVAEVWHRNYPGFANAAHERRAHLSGNGTKRKRPGLIESWDALVEQSSPEVCSQPPYVLLWTGAIAVRNEVCVTCVLPKVPQLAANHIIPNSLHPRRHLLPLGSPYGGHWQRL
jgi:hypothetical protein